MDTTTKNLSLSQLRELKRFGGRVNKFGVNFAVCNTAGEPVLLCEGGRFKSSRKQLIECSSQLLERSNEKNCRRQAEICRLGENSRILAVALRSASCGKRQAQAVGAALIDLGCNQDNSEFIVLGDAGTRQTATVHVEYLSEMLGLLAESFLAASSTDEQIDMVSTELSQVYEELVLLHKISGNMRVTEQDASFLQMACDSLTDIVSVEGIAILLEKSVDDEKKLVLAAGSGLIDINERIASVLHGRLVAEMNSGKEALLDSEVDSHLRYDWPENIKNIIVVPLCGKDKVQADGAEKCHNAGRIIGLMVAINRIDKPELDSTDAKLFNSVANGCAVFIENGRLFKDLKELFIGSLKALTNSIDAKDPYTRGHSERVAFISRWIAERLAEKEPLDDEQIHRIYLAGLLHDIGKIGIDEVVLRKKGKLTKEEFDLIKTHPTIGAGILGGIKQMRDIVPGVLSHHERIDGRGYPNGMNAEQIPLIGKIIGLADSFDAMTSKRTYRDAMTVEEALAEIEKGLGTQFDEKLGKIFIGSDVSSLWDIMQDGFAEVNGTPDFSEYGAMAVGTLIR